MSSYRGAWDGGPPGAEAEYTPPAAAAPPRTDPWTGVSYPQYAPPADYAAYATHYQYGYTDATGYYYPSAGYAPPPAPAAPASQYEYRARSRSASYSRRDDSYRGAPSPRRARSRSRSRHYSSDRSYSPVRTKRRKSVSSNSSASDKSYKRKGKARRRRPVDRSTSPSPVRSVSRSRRRSGSDGSERGRDLKYHSGKDRKRVVATPPRRRKDSASPSPRKRRESTSSPPRKRRDSVSPPPRKRRESGSPRKRRDSMSPPPRKRRESTSPRKRRESTSPRKRRESISPRKRRESSSPRKRRGSTSPQSRSKKDRSVTPSRGYKRPDRQRSFTPPKSYKYKSDTPPKKHRDSSITPPKCYARGGSASSDKSRSRSRSQSPAPRRRERSPRRASSASSASASASDTSKSSRGRSKRKRDRKLSSRRSKSRSASRGKRRSRSVSNSRRRSSSRSKGRKRSASASSREHSPARDRSPDSAGGTPSDDEQRRGQFTVADRKRFWKQHKDRLEKDPRTPPKEMKPPPGAIESTTFDDIEYGDPPDLEGPNFAELLPPPDMSLLASSSRAKPVVPVIKNDGSFLEMFKKMQEATKKAEEAVKKPEIKKPILPFIGKRRGGRVLKTGVVKKAKAIDEQTVDNTPKDAWSLYMQEVKKYRETSCEEERKTRPLVKYIMPEMIKSVQDIKTVPFDPRFPNTNQTRHCYQSYLDFHRCQKVRGEKYEPCYYFQRAYRSLCPNEWVDKWDTQRSEGTFAGRI